MSRNSKKSARRPDRRRGFSYSVTDAQIREWLRFPVREKLLWLEEANRFNEKALRGGTLRVWEAFRAGRI